LKNQITGLTLCLQQNILVLLCCVCFV